VWEEGGGEADVGEVVCCELGGDEGQVDGFGVGKVEAALYAGVEDGEVKGRVGFCDSVGGSVRKYGCIGDGDLRRDYGRDAGEVGDVELDCGDLGAAVFLDEGVEVLCRRPRAMT
jgi:hypothetical protein